MTRAFCPGARAKMRDGKGSRWTRAKKGFQAMSAEAVSTAVGGDGIEIAAKALKQLAGGKDIHGVQIDATTQLHAATTLMHYGLAHVDAFGNAAVGA